MSDRGNPDANDDEPWVVKAGQQYTMRDGSTFFGTYDEAVAEAERLRGTA